MTLQSSGAISFNNINVELAAAGVSATQLAPIDGAPFRNLAGIPASGTQISLSNFYGKQYRITVNLTLAGGNVLNYDVFDNRGPTYIAGISDIIVTVPAPTTVGSTTTAGYAMLVPASFNAVDTVTIVNNGTILGAGGGGGVGGAAPGAAGPATTGGSGGGGGLYVNRATTVTNNGTVAGGGGGGGGSNGALAIRPRPTKQGGPQTFRNGGAGGGGGAGLNSGGGGTGGNPGGTSGSPGTPTAGGAGGPIVTFAPPGAQVAAGGAGGGQGAAGAGSAAPGGAAGNYITGNPLVTWQVTGTRLGGVA